MVRTRRTPASLGVFLAQAVLVVAWALATPPDAAPDEHHHVTRAAAVVRLDIVGAGSPVGGGARVVRVPSFFERYGEQSECFKFNSFESADCSPNLEDGGRTIDVTTNAGVAPPAYYALVGGPLAFADSLGGVYAVRILSGLVAAGFFAAAVALAAATRRRTLLVAGILVSWTPMAQFLAGVVNPSSLEIGSAVLLWTAGAVLVDGAETDDAVLRRAAVAAGVAAVAFVLSRQLSPVWLVVVAATLVGWAAPGRLREVLRMRAARVAAAATAVAGAFATLWLLLYQPLASQADDTGSLPTVGFLDAWAFSLGRLGFLYRTGLGAFGWLDTYLPDGIELVWTGVLGLVLALGAVAAGRRRRVVLLALSGVVVLLPPLIESTQLDTIGPTWQGRYTLPLAMGLPILAGLAVGREVLSRLGSATRLVAWATAAAHAAAFAVALRRYAVGTDGPVWFVGRSQWDSPLPVSVLLVLGVAGALATAAATLRLIPGEPPAP